MKTFTTFFLFFILSICTTVTIKASGFFVASPASDMYWYPNDKPSSYIKEFPEGSTPCFIEIMSDKAEVTIENDSVKVSISQSFYNPTSTDTIPSYYLMPVPKGVSLQDFTFTVNDDNYRAELYTEQQAATMLGDLVQRSGNINWWQYADYQWYRVAIYKTLPRKSLAVKVSYSYAQVNNNGIKEFNYILGTQQYAKRDIRESVMRFVIKEDEKITNFQCTTHPDLKWQYKDKKTIGFEMRANRQRFNKDLHLRYNTTDKKIGCAAYTYNDGKEDGYFMLSFDAGLIDVEESKDVVFAIDIAETMTAEQLVAIKKALSGCLGKLNSDDRFNVVKFSNLARGAFDDFVSATPSNINQALTFVNEMEIGGEANYEGGIDVMLNQSQDELRPYYVLLISAGFPQVGIVKETEELLEEIEVMDVRTLRMFPIAVGENAHSSFLERMANFTQGETLLLSDADNMEKSITAFFQKISSPVLLNLQLYFGDGLEVEQMYPAKPTNLFKGEALTILGRYKDASEATVSLIGDSKRQMLRFDFDINFPDKDTSYPWVSQLWGARAIGETLNQIRSEGDEFEDKGEEIIELAEPLFIINPYTAHLLLKEYAYVKDDEKENYPNFYTQNNTDYTEIYQGLMQKNGKMAMQSGMISLKLAKAAKPSDLKAGQQLMSYQKADGSIQMGIDSEVFTHNRKQFYYNAVGVLTDANTLGKDTDQTIGFNSEQYYALARQQPELAAYFTLSETIRLMGSGGTVYQIQQPAETPEEGEEQEVKD